MKINPSARNIFVFALAFQLYPILLLLLVHLVNPEPNPWSYVGIFAIAEALLLVLILGWKNKAKVDVVDEREVLTQLRVRSFVSRAVEFTLIGLTIYYLVVTQISGLVVLLIIGMVGVLSQLFANSYYHCEDQGI